MLPCRSAEATGEGLAVDASCCPARQHRYCMMCLLATCWPRSCRRRRRPRRDDDRLARPVAGEVAISLLGDRVQVGRAPSRGPNVAIPLHRADAQSQPRQRRPLPIPRTFTQRHAAPTPPSPRHDSRPFLLSGAAGRTASAPKWAAPEEHLQGQGGWYDCAGGGLLWRAPSECVSELATTLASPKNNGFHTELPVPGATRPPNSSFRALSPLPASGRGEFLALPTTAPCLPPVPTTRRESST